MFTHNLNSNVEKFRSILAKFHHFEVYSIVRYNSSVCTQLYGFWLDRKMATSTRREDEERDVCNWHTKRSKICDLTKNSLVFFLSHFELTCFQTNIRANWSTNRWFFSINFLLHFIYNFLSSFFYFFKTFQTRQWAKKEERKDASINMYIHTILDGVFFPSFLQ